MFIKKVLPKSYKFKHFSNSFEIPSHWPSQDQADKNGTKRIIGICGLVNNSNAFKFHSIGRSSVQSMSTESNESASFHRDNYQLDSTLNGSCVMRIIMNKKFILKRSPRGAWTTTNKYLCSLYIMPSPCHDKVTSAKSSSVQAHRLALGWFVGDMDFGL